MIEYRVSLPETVPGPDGPEPFDPINNADHRRRLEANVAQWRAKHTDAGDVSIRLIDMDAHKVVLARPQVESVTDEGNGRKKIQLASEQMKPSKGVEVAANYETRMPGMRMTEFHPYAGYAIMERLSDRQATVRGQVADYLKINPWDVRVVEQKDGGWRCDFQQPFLYQPDRDDPRMEKAAVAIGADGWWAESDPKGNMALIHPGEPPTFLKTHAYPFDLLADPEYRDHTPIGVRLPRVGGDPYEPLLVDWRENSFLLVGGEGGSGKSVAVNGMLAAIVAQRVELSIVDLANKATDYYWIRPWVTPKHWGCGSIVQAAGVLNRLVWEIEHGERARVWMENAWQNWLDIPRWAKERYPLHYIIVDEYSSLVDEAKEVPDIPNPERKLPAVFERLFTAQAENDIRRRVARLLRTARAQGYRMIVISQTINERSGLGPTVRDLFGHHVAMGPSPSDAMLKGVFHDLASMPDVPRRVFDDGVTKGVGRAELAGMKGCVFKTCYAGDGEHTDVEMLAHALVEKVGLPADVDRGRYFDTLRRHGEDDPVDAEYMRFLTERIDLPYADALASDRTLLELKKAWDESKANFGEGASDGGSPMPAPDADEDGGSSGSTSERHPVQAVLDDEPSGRLMDASALARLMEG